MHTHSKSAAYVSSLVYFQPVCTRLCVSRNDGGKEGSRKRGRVLFLFFFHFLALFKAGSISLLSTMSLNSTRGNEPQNEYEQGHIHCHYKISAAICRQASYQPPEDSTSGQIDLLASELTVGLEITCLICEPQ